MFVLDLWREILLNSISPRKEKQYYIVNPLRSLRTWHEKIRNNLDEGLRCIL